MASETTPREQAVEVLVAHGTHNTVGTYDGFEGWCRCGEHLTTQPIHAAWRAHVVVMLAAAGLIPDAAHDAELARAAAEKALREASAYLQATGDSETAIGNLLYRADRLAEGGEVL